MASIPVSTEHFVRSLSIPISLQRSRSLVQAKRNNNHREKMKAFCHKGIMTSTSTTGRKFEEEKLKNVNCCSPNLFLLSFTIIEFIIETF